MLYSSQPVGASAGVGAAAPANCGVAAAAAAAPANCGGGAAASHSVVNPPKVEPKKKCYQKEKKLRKKKKKGSWIKSSI